MAKEKEQYKRLEDRIDSDNRPKGYIVGGSAGNPEITKEYGLVGLPGTLLRGSRYGYEISMIDLWKDSTLMEPGTLREFQHIQEQQAMEVGVHLTPGMDLTSAYGDQWNNQHKSFILNCVGAVEICRGRFVLMHSAASIVQQFGAMAEERGRPLVTPQGDNLADFVENPLKHDPKARGRLGSFKPGWNPYAYGDENHDKKKDLPNLKDWFMTKFGATIWFPGSVPQPEVMVPLNRIRTMKDIEFASGLSKFLLNADTAFRQQKKSYNERIDRVNEALRNIDLAERVGRITPEDAQKQRERIKQERDKINEEFKESIPIFNEYDNLPVQIFRRNEEGEAYVHPILLAVHTGGAGVKNVLSIYTRIIDEDKVKSKEIISLLDKLQNDDILKNAMVVLGATERRDIRRNFEYFRSGGSAADEHVAYHAIAKWMYLSRDPLWKRVVEERVEEGFHDPDAIVADVDAHGGRPTEPLRKMVAAVAAKYIQGHFDVPVDDVRFKSYLANIDFGVATHEGNEEELLRRLRRHGKDTKIYDYLHKNGAHLYIETQMTVGRGGSEGQIKIMSIDDHLQIIKAFNDYYRAKNISYCIDFEHLLINYINPEEEIKRVSPGNAKYITMIHINPPTIMDGFHKILRKFSRDVENIYRWLHILREKGMKDCYFIWEIGTDQGVYESMPIVKKYAAFLSKGVKPEDLPPDFFGIDKNFEAMQAQAVSQHLADPLKGMLFMLPEPEHTLVGLTAGQTKAGIWEKEKLR